MDQKYLLLANIILVLCLVDCSSRSPEDNDSKKLQNAVEYVSTATAERLLSKNENAVVLDVRTPQEYEASHINDAININIYDEDFRDQVAELDKERIYVVHCAANTQNGRSEKSLAILQELGFQNLVSMDGGFAKWMQEERPIAP